MKKFFIYPILPCLLFSSCIDQNYDLNKIKKDDISITRDVIVEVNETTNSSVSSIFGLDEVLYNTDNEGNMIVPLDNDRHFQAVISEAEISSGDRIGIDGLFTLKIKDVPSVLRKSKSFVAPFIILVENPTDGYVDFYGRISDCDKSSDFGPACLQPGANLIDVRTFSEALPYLTNISKDVTVSSFSFSGKGQTKSAVTEASESYEYTFDLSAYMPLSVDPGFEFVDTVSLDDLNISDVKKYLNDNQMDASTFSIDATVVSSVPLAVVATIECTYTDNGKGFVNVTPEIKAGTVESPVTTKVNIKSELTFGLADVSGASVILKCRVPEDVFDAPVSLNENQGYQITLNDIEIKVGASL